MQKHVLAVEQKRKTKDDGGRVLTFTFAHSSSEWQMKKATSCMYNFIRAITSTQRFRMHLHTNIARYSSQSFASLFSLSLIYFYFICDYLQ